MANFGVTILNFMQGLVKLKFHFGKTIICRQDLKVYHVDHQIILVQFGITKEKSSVNQI